VYEIISYPIMISSSARFHAKMTNESLAKYTGFFEPRVSFRGRVFNDI